METKHTKGEWVVKSNSELCWVESKTHHIATVSFCNEYNAKLIAAVPDLLEVAEKIVELLKYSEYSNEIEVRKLAEQAIKKATL